MKTFADLLMFFEEDEFAEEGSKSYMLKDNLTAELAGWEFNLIEIDCDGEVRITSEDEGYTNYEETDLPQIEIFETRKVF